MKTKRILALILVLCVLSSQLPATIWATTETLSQDYPVIMLDQEITAEVPEDGYAYFQFTPEYTEAYFFYSSATQGDPYVTLYDSEMNQLNSSDDYNSLNFGLSCTLEAGQTFVLQIGSYSGASSFPVKLEVVHSYIGEIVTESSCTENGLERYTCQYCDNSYEEAIPFSHSYGEDGICINCGEEYLLTGVCGENVSWSLNYQGQLTISGIGAMYDYAWGESPFCEYTSISSVIIENGVTSIGEAAFFACSLTSIVASNSVISIGDNAFRWCGNLTSIVIPDSVTSIGDSAFFYCDSLSSIALPDSVTSIGGSVFAYCYSLQKFEVTEGNPSYSTDTVGVLFDKEKTTLICAPGVISEEYIIPDSVTSIGGYAFSSCSGLPGIVIPDSVTSIGASAFSSCRSLQSIDIPDSVTSIGDEAFYNCSSLTSIVIPQGVTSIGYYTFNGCNSLTSIVIPDSVTSIGDEAFYNCSSLTSIVIPDSVTSIGNYAFRLCSSLQQFEVAEENPNYSNDTRGVLFDKGKNTLICAPDTISGEYIIPDGVTTIGDDAFSACSSLTSITIPDSVTSIGLVSFMSCYNLTSIVFEGDAPFIGEAAFVDVTTEVLYPETNSTWTEDVMQNYGGNLAWVPYGLLASGECGDSLTWQLSEKGKLIISGSGDMSDYSEVAAPWSEYTVSEVVIKAGVESISNGAFSGCTELTKICFEGDAPVIAEAAFTGITAEAFYPAGNATWTEDVLQDYGGTLSWTVLEVIVASGSCGENVTWKLNADGLLTISGEGSMYDYELDGSPFYSNTAITNVIIDEGVTGIGINSFRYCQNLQSVSIPDSVLSIGDTAFHFCSNLTNIQFGSGLVSIGDSAFNSCGSLPEMVIPNGVVTLGELAFAYCYGLAHVTIPETVETIGRLAFGYGQALQSITVSEQNTHYSSDDAGVLFNKDKTQLICAPKLIEGAYSIPESVATIASSAFGSCTHLTDITIPEGVLIIEDSAFSNCTGLTSIYIPGSVTSICTAAFADCHNLQKFQVADSSITYCSDDTGVLFNKDKTRLLCAPGMLEGAYVIPGSVVSIDSEAFSNCQKLTDITIPEGVTAIEALTFWNCRGLTSVTIPNSVITIGPGAFINCRNATSIVLGNNVARIANQAFDYCSSLASIVIPASVTEIGSWAFENCSSLAEIVFEGDAPSIVLSAFNGINATAKYPAANTTWNEDTLLNYGGSLTWEAYSLSEEDITSGTCGENITWTLDANGLLTVSGTGAMYDYTRGESPFFENPDVLSIVIEEGVTSLCDYAFYGCYNATSISIPASVSTIGTNFFGSCDALEKFEVAEGNTHYSVDAAGVLFNADKTTLIRAPGTMLAYVIPENVTVIGDYAFECCWELANVSIPNTVTTIGRRAFGDCCNLQEVTIPASVTALRPWVFSCCDSLRKIVFEGDAPATDGDHIYENIYYRAYIYYPVSNPTWTEAVMDSYGEGVTWIAYQYDVDEIVFAGTSLSLNGDISVNFYVDLAEELLADENLRMVFNVGEQTWEVALADALTSVQNDGSVWYRFSCSMAAKEMTDRITVQMYGTHGAIGKTKAYGVASYYYDICEQFDREEKAELFALIESMLNYGAAAQEHFGYNTDNLANAAVSTAIPDAVDASAYAPVISDYDDNLSYAGMSLVLESNTALRVFFRTVSGADISGYTFTVNGQTVTPVQRGNLWYIELANIAAKDLDTACTFTAGDVTVECSALSYVCSVLNKADALDEKLVAVCKALYAYNEAANAYFSN